MSNKRLPEWQRQAIVRALVMGELTNREIAVELGIHPNTVSRVARGLDTCDPEPTNASAYG